MAFKEENVDTSFSLQVKPFHQKYFMTKLFLFRILEDFLDVMNHHCSKFCDILGTLKDGKEFNVFPLVCRNLLNSKLFY